MEVIRATRGGDSEETHWAYDLVRADGVQVRVEITCTSTAVAVAQAHENTSALEMMRDPQTLAETLAGSVQTRRGVPIVEVFFDEMDAGWPRHNIHYPT